MFNKTAKQEATRRNGIRKLVPRMIELMEKRSDIVFVDETCFTAN